MQSLWQRLDLRLILGLFVMVVLASSGCNSFQTPAEKRAQHASVSTGPIFFGIVDTSVFPSMFLEGVRTAIEEINQRGGLLGRTLTTLERDDKGDDEQAQTIAEELASNRDLIAVVGHIYSGAAISASIVYEEEGIVYVSPGATHPNLTRYGKRHYIFRNTFNGEQIGAQVADFAERAQAKNILVFYERENDAYKRTADSFNSQAREKGMTIVATRSYSREETDFRPTLSFIKEQIDEETIQLDSIFIAGPLPASGILIKQIRDFEIQATILGTDDLDSPELWTAAGKAAENTIVMTTFDPDQPSRLTREFVNRFQDKYGIEPDSMAAQGYDAVQVIANAIEQSGSIEPAVIASTLKFLSDWEGVIGQYSFTPEGDITGAKKKFLFKEAIDNGFRFLNQEAFEHTEPDPLYVIKDMTLRIPLKQDIHSLDPAFAVEDEERELIEQLFLPLIRFDPNTYQVRPGSALATDCNVSNDGTVYTCFLRQDVKWTDSKPVTAHNLVWTIQRNIDPKTGSQSASMLSFLKNGLAIRKGQMPASAIGVRALDAYRVEFTLERPFPSFLTMLNSPIFRPLPQHVIEQYGDKWTQKEHLQVNGPYTIALWEKSMVIILRKNQMFYDHENVNIPEIRYSILPDSSVGMEMYRQDELDVLGGPYLSIPVEELIGIKTHPELSKEYTLQEKMQTVSFGFNTRRPPFDDVLARQAIAAAVDRHLLVNASTRQGERPATTFIRPPLIGAVDERDGIGIRFDPLQAQKRLTEAGYPDGNNFPEITFIYPSEYRTVAKSIIDSLTYHLKINIVPQEVALLQEYHALLKQPQAFHLFLFAWEAEYPDANNFLNETFHPDHSPNVVGWKNVEFAQLVEKAMSETEPEQRKALYKRAEQILCQEEVVVVPLYYSKSPMLVKPRVKNRNYMDIGGQPLYKWRLER